MEEQKEDKGKLSDIKKDMFFELTKEDLNDPKYGWKKTVEQKEKDGYGFTMHQRPM